MTRYTMRMAVGIVVGMLVLVAACTGVGTPGAVSPGSTVKLGPVQFQLPILGPAEVKTPALDDAKIVVPTTVETQVQPATPGQTLEHAKTTTQGHAVVTEMCSHE